MIPGTPLRPLIFLVLALHGANVLCVTVTVTTRSARCGLNNGYAIAFVTGGIPPYSYAWDNGATTASVDGLAPGDYSVTVTDGLNNTAGATGTVTAIFEMTQGGPTMLVLPDCMGMCTGVTEVGRPGGGTLPYNYPPEVFENGLGMVVFSNLCFPGTGTVTVTDANGCPGIIDLNGAVDYFQPYLISVQGTTPACEDQPNGSMTLFASSGSLSVVDVVRVGGGYSQTFSPPIGTPYEVSGLPAGNYQITSRMPTSPPGFDCSLQVNASVPMMAPPCGGALGRVYHDADQGCTFGVSDLPIPYKVLEILPGPSYAITDHNGSYARSLPLGSYSIRQVLLDETQLCPPNDPQPFTLTPGSPQTTIDLANLSNVPHDLSVHIESSSARPGFPTHVRINVRNNSAFPSGAVSVALAYDNLLLDPGAASWNIPVIAPFAWANFHFTATVPPDIGLLGSNLNYGATATNSASEANTANNTVFVDVTVTGSYDPNDKQGFTSSRTSDNQYFLEQDDHIDYTVRFQNTGTSAAETVVIRDVIDTDLDITSLWILGASHDFVPSFGEGRELVFTFNEIDLPDSTTDLLGSQGFISYRLKPHDNVVVGDVLENTANIYFDFNPPIITNTTSHVVDFSTAVAETPHVARTLLVSPNPVHEVLAVTLPDAASKNWQLLSIDGRSINLPHTYSSGIMQLDVRHLDPGNYVLHTQQGIATFVKH